MDQIPLRWIKLHPSLKVDPDFWLRAKPRIDKRMAAGETEDEAVWNTITELEAELDVTKRPGSNNTIGEHDGNHTSGSPG